NLEEILKSEKLKKTLKKIYFGQKNLYANFANDLIQFEILEYVSIHVSEANQHNFFELLKNEKSHDFIKELHLDRLNYKHEDLDRISNLKYLEIFTIETIFFTNFNNRFIDILKIASLIPTLKSLSLIGFIFHENINLSVFSDYKNLKKFEISYSCFVNEKIFYKIFGLTNLRKSVEELYLINIGVISDEYARNISEFKNLELLNIKSSFIWHSSLSIFCNNKNFQKSIKKLNLFYILDNDSVNTTPSCLIKKLKTLEHLEITTTNAYALSLIQISQSEKLMDSLKKISIEGLDIDREKYRDFKMSFGENMVKICIDSHLFF
ncbi:hypothetical protein DMUE_3978, partial [Dictyocoela muelleri]